MLVMRLKDTNQDRSHMKLLLVMTEEIKAYITGTQSAPVELNRGMIDIAIIGEDWVKKFHSQPR